MFLKPTKAAVLVEDYIFRNDLAVTISGDPIEPIITMDASPSVKT